jgi:hypothetical protein
MATDEWRPYQISMASFIKFFREIGAARRKNAQGARSNYSNSRRNDFFLEWESHLTRDYH